MMYRVFFLADVARSYANLLEQKKVFTREKWFNPHSFIVLGHQYDCHDVI